MILIHKKKIGKFFTEIEIHPGAKVGAGSVVVKSVTKSCTNEKILQKTIAFCKKI